MLTFKLIYAGKEKQYENVMHWRNMNYLLYILFSLLNVTALRIEGAKNPYML